MPTSSCCSRFSTWRAVSFLPSWPASTDVLMPTVIERLGSSTMSGGSGRGSSASASVSPIVISGMPATAMMSPGPASSAGTRSSASVRYSSTIFTRSIVPSMRHHATCSPLRTRPLRTRHSASRPRYGDASRLVTSAWNGMTLVVLGRGNALEDELAQRLEVAALDVGVERRPTGARVRVDDRELDLVLVGAEIDEELVHLVEDLGDARVGPVDLVDDEDHRQVRFERLAQHEARLRERALARVDEQQHAVDHRERPLDLAAEVGVTGRVDDVERHVAVADRRVLGEDRDALLALEVVRVHDPLVDVLVGAERARLPEQGVDERGLAVVDVGDDRHVAQIVARGHENSDSGGPPV